MGWDGAPEPRAGPMHTPMKTCTAHTSPTSAHTPRTNTHIHAHTNALNAHSRVHTHWDLSFLPPRRLRGLQGNRSQVPVRERDALPTGAPDSPLSPRYPRKPGTRLLPGAQEGCPQAAFSLEEPHPPSGFQPPQHRPPHARPAPGPQGGPPLSNTPKQRQPRLGGSPPADARQEGGGHHAHVSSGGGADVHPPCRDLARAQGLAHSQPHWARPNVAGWGPERASSGI